jgi:hypothetical protein
LYGTVIYVLHAVGFTLQMNAMLQALSIKVQAWVRFFLYILCDRLSDEDKNRLTRAISVAESGEGSTPCGYDMEQTDFGMARLRTA